MIFQKPRRPVSRVFLHCSASDNPAHDNVETLRAWHLANGWADIGYHFVVLKNGTIAPGRSIELTPAAQNGNNTGTIAICCTGLTRELFTQAQYDAVRDLCGQIDRAYGVGRVTFHGHCEVSPKTCPVYDYRTVLGLDARGHLGMAATSLPSTDADTPVETTATLRYGASGEGVRWMQTLLRRVLKAPAIAADGVFGRGTETALKAFQASHHLIADGVYGPLTREALVDAADAIPPS